MPKYVAGDRVRIVDYLGVTRKPCSFRLNYLRGEGVIHWHDPKDNTYLVELPGSRTWYWPEEDLAAVLPTPAVPTVEFNKGDEVITKAYPETEDPYYLPAKMARYAGQAGHINEVKTEKGQLVYRVHGWYWPANALRRPIPPVEIKVGDRVRLLVFTKAEADHAFVYNFTECPAKRAYIGTELVIEYSGAKHIQGIRAGVAVAWPRCAIEKIDPPAAAVAKVVPAKPVDSAAETFEPGDEVELQDYEGNSTPNFVGTRSTVSSLYTPDWTNAGWAYLEPSDKVRAWPVHALKKVEPETAAEAAARLGLKIGDTVECVHDAAHIAAYPYTGTQTGYRGKIKDIYSVGCDGQLEHRASVGNGRYNWPLHALRKIERKPKPVHHTAQAQSVRVIETSTDGRETTYHFNAPCRVTFTTAD